MQACAVNTEEGIGGFVRLRAAANNFASRIVRPRLKEMFLKCFFNTLDTTVRFDEKGTYIITGDIDAMWLRDSSAQVMQYLLLAKECADTRRLIKGLSRRQMYYITCDPYANAFNQTFNGKGWRGDETEMSDIVFERKFELDSLCYPLWLAERYYLETGDKSIFEGSFAKAFDVIIDTLKLEQKHENSKYYHYRPTETAEFSVPNRGRGGACGHTGLVWSGYRPSDDPQIYSYFIPGNMFVSVVLGLVPDIAKAAGISKDKVKSALKLKGEIDGGIKKYGVVDHPKYGKIYAFETDGLGNHLLMDDANIPSLLSLPYLGFCSAQDELYVNTRKYVLSEDNPYYFKGKAITGVGSPHTPNGYVWPISLIMEALTTEDETRINDVVSEVSSSDGGTGYIHEGVYRDDDKTYTRDWFAWANSLFSYFIIKQSGKINIIK